MTGPDKCFTGSESALLLRLEIAQKDCFDQGHRAAAILFQDARAEIARLTALPQPVDVAQAERVPLSSTFDAIYDALGDIETDDAGNCRWSAVANIQRAVYQMARDAEAHPTQGGDKGEAVDLVAAVKNYFDLWNRCGGSEAISAEKFADARQSMRDALAAPQPTAAAYPPKEAIVRTLNGIMVSHNGYTSPVLVERIANAILAMSSTSLCTPERNNRFCKNDDCPYPDCLVDGVCPSQPASEHSSTQEKSP